MASNIHNIQMLPRVSYYCCSLLPFLFHPFIFTGNMRFAVNYPTIPWLLLLSVHENSANVVEKVFHFPASHFISAQTDALQALKLVVCYSKCHISIMVSIYIKARKRVLLIRYFNHIYSFRFHSINVTGKVLHS